MKPDNPLHVPRPNSPGRAIVEAGALFTVSLRGTDQFIQYCRERGVSIDAERLYLLEKLGRFGPMFRVLDPGDTVHPFRLPIQLGSNWFEKGWAWDTSIPGSGYEVPESSDENQEAYYSIFQLDELHSVINNTSMNVQLEWLLRDELEGKKSDWNARADEWIKFAKATKNHAAFNRTAAFLCQMISERYYPYTQSDGRRMHYGRSAYSDAFIVAQTDEPWFQYVRNWKPEEVAKLYGLTKGNLRNMYESLAVSQAMADPLEDWHQLVRFVSVDMRKRLKGDALFAENVRSQALMLRMLYEELFDEELPIPNEVSGQIITHMPELAVRKDARKFLEYVSNRFHVNPQPLVALFVEGPTEQRAIEMIFDRYLGTHPGKYGIEIIILGGVDVATGAKEDRFRAIFRLIDYLHHHQTLTYLLLDNEGAAKSLLNEANKAKSIHNPERFVTRSDHIQLWDISFEFDNFTTDEIAQALSIVSRGKATFTTSEVESCKAAAEAGAALKKLYLSRVGSKANKLELIEALVELMLSPVAPIKIADRPIVQTIDRISKFAARNPLPTMQEYWERNQRSEFLGKLRTSKAPAKS